MSGEQEAPSEGQEEVAVRSPNLTQLVREHTKIAPRRSSWRHASFHRRLLSIHSGNASSSPSPSADILVTSHRGTVSLPNGEKTKKRPAS